MEDCRVYESIYSSAKMHDNIRLNLVPHSIYVCTSNSGFCTKTILFQLQFLIVFTFSKKISQIVSIRYLKNDANF